MRCPHTLRYCTSLCRSGLFLPILIGLCLAGACQKPDPPPVAYAGPTLASADFGLAEPVDTAENGFVILEPGPSQGRFPAALAIVRLDVPSPLFVCDDHLFVADRGWEIATIKQEEAAYWNGLLKRIPPSRAVYVMDRSSVISPDCGLQEVITAVQSLRIEQCLIYGPRLVEDGCTGLGGVIVDVNTGKHLAYVQSNACPLDFEPPRPDRSKYDRSHQDVNYLAARRFEREVRNCILEMIARDTPATTTQPSPWQASHDSRLPSDSVPVYIVPNRRAGN